jgi:protein-tyrosine phosphatase
MAEAMLRERAELSGAPLDVSSAGLATEGRPPPDATLAAMRRRGIELSAHKSRLVTPEMLLEADVIIGMTRAHVWEAAIRAPEVVPRAFVLGELVRLNDEIGHRYLGEPLADWRARLHSERGHGTQHALASDEIPDPYGRRRRFHERVAGRIEQLVLRMSDCVFDPLHPFSEMRWREGKLVWRPPQPPPMS